ncbi:MAG: YdbL family protein [Candidatus Sedimenticola sp. 6PFRAG5]
MRMIKLTTAFATLLILAACVTINIYFPAAQAEEAAGRIVDEILGEDNDAQPNDEAPKGDDNSANLPLSGQAYQFASGIVDIFIPQAHAAQPDFNVNTPKIRKLRASMKSRHKSLSPYYRSGAIGFTRDALVAVHNASAISLKDRNKVKKLTSAENRDRNALYQSIAEANGHPEWEPDVRAVFAKTWAREAGKGWWYQNSKGQWKQK